ncbi:hypothetical protein ROA7450_00492 [Roseovarius albus]|uniref:DUF2950 domain-containing protein n=1 Tax=Roseovarius albus TaxID=1247867 RepID=A0A1X6YCP7_9RHOB|nr:DUF2950 family protein [Roseovarius albus]SLN16910.1 hypothetical protein ROA7450_00492 [Roseovarius albus]
MMGRLSQIAFVTLSTVTFGQTLWADGAPVYATPQAALEALVAGLETGDAQVAVDAMDPAVADLMRVEDEGATQQNMASLLALYREGYRFVPAENAVVIELGEDGWPFPVPLMQVESGWSYDALAAEDELLARQIGGNEIAIIEALEGYVELQSEFRQTDQDGDGVMEFAASIISSPDNRDGLFWDGENSLIGDLAARANLDGFEEGGEDAAADPFNGYYFRLLKAQGDAAPGGAMPYMVNGNMVAGHALLAVPAEYGVTGVHSFQISESGVVWEADLGPESLEAAIEVVVFNPDENWSALTN